MVVFNTLIILKWEVTWYFTGNNRISVVLTDFWLVVAVQDTSFRFEEAMAAEGGVVAAGPRL
jgi:outer membrane lipoprotein-sorting protein